MTYKFFRLSPKGDNNDLVAVATEKDGVVVWNKMDVNLVNSLDHFKSVDLADDDNPDGRFESDNPSHWKALPGLIHSHYFWCEAN
jgi:hypothetical protein